MLKLDYRNSSNDAFSCVMNKKKNEDLTMNMKKYLITI